MNSFIFIWNDLRYKKDVRAVKTTSADIKKRLKETDDSIKETDNNIDILRDMVSDSSKVNKKNYLRLMEAIKSRVDDDDSNLVSIHIFT